MSEETAIPEAGPESEPEQENPRGKPGFGIWLVALISLAALALSAYLFYRMEMIGADNQSVNSMLADTRARLDQLTSLAGSLRDHEQLSARKRQRLEERQTQLEDRLLGLMQKQDMDNRDWALAEIEHLLVVATHRLQLEQNPVLALAALQAADDRLASIDDPGLLPVRQQITSDINSLNAVPAVDISGLVLFLSDLAGRVAELPLQPVVINEEKPAGPAQTEQQGAWDRLLASIWQELRGLVQVSKQGEDRPATLLPEQQYFLYQNLRLQLESARYAVLRRDTENLHVSVDIIDRWLAQYFDTRDTGVANIIESISRMRSLELNPPLPDIQSSLESLRAYRRSIDADPAESPEAAP